MSSYRRLIASFLVICTAAWGQVSSSRPPISFIQNNGQWKESIGYRAYLSGMDVLLEKRGWLLRLKRKVDEAARLSSAEGAPGRRSRVQASIIRMTFEGAAAAAPEGERVLPGRFNFLAGTASAKRHTDVPGYGDVRYRGVYPGVEVRVHGDHGRLEYDLLLSPGADLRDVRMRVEGAQGLSIDAEGNLVVATALGPLSQPRPLTWETLPDGIKVPLPCRYVLVEDGLFGFEVAGWNREQPLMVDPQLVWSTYFGGTQPYCWDEIWDVAVDPSGVVTVFGLADTWDEPSGFPTSPGAFKEQLPALGTNSYTDDLFVARLDPNQSGAAQLVWSTFLGFTGDNGAVQAWPYGNNGTVRPGRMAVSDDGSVTIAANAFANSTLATTPSAFRSAAAGYDLYVTTLNPTGTDISFGAYLGGTTMTSEEYLTDLAVDPATGLITIVGVTDDPTFPTTVGAYAESAPIGTPVTVVACAGAINSSAFAIQVDPASAQIVWSTFLPGIEDLYRNCATRPSAVGLDGSGSVTIAGFTFNPAFPTTPGAPHDTDTNGNAGFILRMDPSQTGTAQLSWSGLFSDWGLTASYARMIVDPSGVITVAARVGASPARMTTPGAYQSGPAGGDDVFIQRLDLSLTPAAPLVWSTYLGGSGREWLTALAVDTGGAVTIGGWTESADFPVTLNAHDTTYDAWKDGFVSRLSADGTQLLASTYLAGTGDDDWVSAVAVGPLGVTYAAGGTYTADFPTTAGAFQEVSGGGGASGYADGFIVKLNMGNSQAGPNVTVQPDPDATLTFGEVTEPGETTVSYSASAPALPAGFELGGTEAGGSSFIEVTTTATFTGSVELAFHYDEGLFTDEASIRLLHYEGGAWVDVTTTLDTVNDIVYGTTTSLSPFAIVQAGPIPVAVDIKPGSSQNTINLGSNGNVPVAVLGSATLDVQTIDPLTVTLANATVHLHGNGTPQATFQDVNQDGFLDLVVHVETSALQLTETDVQAVLQGQLAGNGRFIRGTDTVRIVP